MGRVVPVETRRIGEDRACLFESHSVLVVVALGLPDIPRERIIVYTLSLQPRKGAFAGGHVARSPHSCAGGLGGQSGKVLWPFSIAPNPIRAAQQVLFGHDS